MSAFSVSACIGLVRQFDPVAMLFIPLVFLGKGLFEPYAWRSATDLSTNGRMIDDEVVAACVGPQVPIAVNTVGSKGQAFLRIFRQSSGNRAQE